MDSFHKVKSLILLMGINKYKKGLISKDTHKINIMFLYTVKLLLIFVAIFYNINVTENKIC